MTDEQIVGLFNARDEAAIKEAQNKYKNYCSAIATRLLDNAEDAEECVSDALLAAWNSIPPHQPEKLAAYLGKLTRNKALDCREKREAGKRGGGEAALSVEELDECLPDHGSVEQEADARLLGKTISDFLRTLPDESRQMFLLRYFYAYSVREIAHLYRCREGRVGSILTRTRKKLRAALEKEGIL